MEQVSAVLLLVAAVVVLSASTAGRLDATIERRFT
jgi:hypothetical protein